MKQAQFQPSVVISEVLRSGLSGLLFALAAYFWFSKFHLEDGFTAPDWFDYCSGVISLLEDEDRLWPLKRSRAAGWVAASAATKLGIVDGLLLSSVMGSAVMGAMLYAWGLALNGRRAAVATVGLALCLGPVVLQARSLTFYPWVTAGLLGAGAAASVAVRWPALGTMLGAGVGLGIGLLMDVRALIWVAPALGIVLLAALFRRASPVMRLLRIAALVGPLLVSYQLGRFAYPAPSYTLEEQVDVRALYARMGSAAAEVQPPYSYPSRYVWGRQRLEELPRTISFLASQARLTRPDDAVSLTDPRLVRAHVTPWTRIAGVVWLGSVVVLWRRRWRCLAFAATSLPWFLALSRMPEMVNLYPRFLTQGLPVLALAGGVCMGAMWRRLEQWFRPDWRWPIGLVGLSLLVLGGVPSPLSPAAEWRVPWAPELLEYHQVAEVARGRERGQRLPEAASRCAAALQAGPAAEATDFSRWLDVDDARAEEYRTRNTPVPPPLDGGIH